MWYKERGGTKRGGFLCTRFFYSTSFVREEKPGNRVTAGDRIPRFCVELLPCLSGASDLLGNNRVLNVGRSKERDETMRGSP